MLFGTLWLPIVLLLLWSFPTWGKDNHQPPPAAAESPQVTTNVQIQNRDGRISPQGDDGVRKETKSVSGVIDLEHIKRTLEQFQIDQKPESLDAPPQRQEERLELTLQQSIEIALKHNLRLQLARLTMQAVQTEIPRAKAKFHPTVGVSLTGSGITSSAADDDDFGANTITTTAFVSEDIPTGATLVVSGELSGQEETRPRNLSREIGSDLLISIVQPLLRGGGLVVATRQIRDAEFDLRIEEANLRADILRVTANAKSAYYHMLLAEKIIEVTIEAIERDKTLVEASQSLFNAGLVTKRDVFSAEIILAQDSARLVNVQADLESAKNTLLDVLGLPFTATVVLLDKDISFHPVPLELERWITTAIAHRPELMAVAEASRKNLLNIRVEKNAVLPNLDFVASYERFQGNSNFGNAFDFSGEAWTAGMVFSVPIGNVAAKSALARAQIEQTRLQTRLEQTKRQIELEVRDAVITLRRSLERMKVLTAGVEQARGKLEFARARFVLGLATNLDITDAQEALLNAETDLLSAIVDYNIGLAELEARIAAPI